MGGNGGGFTGVGGVGVIGGVEIVWFDFPFERR